jgi:tetratricopeptide (TPR) repeat protein
MTPPSALRRSLPCVAIPTVVVPAVVPTWLVPLVVPALVVSSVVPALVVPLVLSACLLAAAAHGQVVLPPGLGQVAGGQTVPTPAYDLALQALAEGNFSGGLEIAGREYQGGVKIGGQRWIDSIASAAAVGECRYELGGYREAIAAYEEGLLLATTHPDWLVAVQWPQQPLQPRAGRRVATWGRSQRGTRPAGLPETVSIRRGGADPQEVLQRGGVLAAPVDYPIRPHEIFRSLEIAIYRHAELLGELARQSPALDAATRALARRAAPPAHYSQSWIDVALGTAYWVQGKPDLALPLLNRGLVVGEGLDHPLTAWGLIVLGRIALDSDQAAAAAKLFEEATYAAADHGDARALEEAFRFAFTAHMVAGTRGVPPSIRGGCEWARGGLPVLHANLLAMQAECLAAAGDPRAAKAAVKEIDGRLLRGDPGRGRSGALAAYAAALAQHAAGDTAAADAELDRAIVIEQPRSPRLFQTTRLVELIVAGSSLFSDREADGLFARLLGDPTARDLAADPLAALAVMAAPRGDAFETWVQIAARRGEEAALEAAEATARDRWLAAQRLGGRPIAVQRLLGTDPQELPPGEAARRAALLARYPELAAVLDKLAQVRTTLTAAVNAAAAGQPAAAEGRPALPGAEADWEAYRTLAKRLGQFVARIAAGRDFTPLDFPPRTAAAEIRGRLPPRHLLLSFHWTKAGLFGVLESRERAAFWQVRQIAALPRALQELAKSLCLFDPIAPVPTDRLLADEWRGAAAQVERILFENSKITLAEGIDELVIVPDGLLWYLPFELLPVASNRPGDPAAGEARLLREVCRVRYAPIRSLAVLPFAAGRSAGPIGVHAGRMFRGDKADEVAALRARMTDAVERCQPLPVAAAGPPPALVAALFSELAICEELGGEGPIASRPLLQATAGSGGMTFADWLAPPLKRTRLILLPGLQTAMAGGLAKLPARPGEDLFVAATDLLAAGSETAVVSRWRMGGKVAADLMTEFLRDMTAPGPEGGFPTAAASWQRAVDLAIAEEPDPQREPRLKPVAKGVLPDARHPFLWAGYMLIDCGAGGPAAPPPAPVVQPAR